jgi:hypothetical protein
MYMKKKLAVVMGIILVFGLILTGCGGADSDKVVQDTVALAQAQLGSIEGALGGMAEMSIEARGHSVVMIFKYTVDLQGQEEMIKVGLENQMNAEAPNSFMPLVEEMKKKGVDDASFIVEIKDMNNNMLFTNEYK